MCVTSFRASIIEADMTSRSSGESFIRGSQPLTHNEKTIHLIEALRERGVGQYTTAPPHYRLLWRLGWETPPPMFQRFLPQFIASGTYFAVTWGPLMWLFQWRYQDISVADAMITSVGTGAIFGLAMAIYFRWKARNFGLPEWEAYPDTLDAGSQRRDE
jgi:hypothetical protein